MIKAPFRLLLTPRTRERGFHSTIKAPYALNLRSTKLRDSAAAGKNPKNEESNNTSAHTTPARTRFAPSPTGSVHLGSLRTALYNYLLARNTGGQFLLRLEDTDRKRLVPGAEENIRQTLQWAGLNWDEEYSQSTRSDIYYRYAIQLLDQGSAYRCFCPKHRLDSLRESARALTPPSMASYDRKCARLVSREESDQRAADGEPHTIRFKAPPHYEPFHDILHGTLSLQTQTNPLDVRYEDPVLLKSDGLPTYHLANVVDDHLMDITHVIRGEEWLLSAPKHCAIYRKLGWEPPKYAHIPLLTSVDSDKKLSKRQGDASVMSMAQARGILPEALVNFVALFGWSPTHPAGSGPEAELFTLDELTNQFSLDGLTRGNAKVDDKKLLHFNQHFFRRRLSDPGKCDELIKECHEGIQKSIRDETSSLSDIPDYIRTDLAYTTRIFHLLKNNINSTMEFIDRAQFLYTLPTWQQQVDQYKKRTAKKPNSNSSIDKTTIAKVLDNASNLFAPTTTGSYDPSIICEQLLDQGFTKRQVFSSLRYALAGGVPGLKIPDILTLLGPDRSKARIDRAMTFL